MDIELVKRFGSLANFRDFLSEKINDGYEISRGKTAGETSKEEKKEKKISKEVKKNADGSATETHYDTDTGEEQPNPAEMPPPTPPVDPTAAPGSQIAVGRKDVEDNEADADKAVKIEISGQKEKLNLKPKITVKDNGTERK